MVVASKRQTNEGLTIVDGVGHSLSCVNLVSMMFHDITTHHLTGNTGEWESLVMRLSLIGQSVHNCM